MKELLDNGSLKLIYMPTDELVADILTMPLTGWKFQKKTNNYFKCASYMGVLARVGHTAYSKKRRTS